MIGNAGPWKGALPCGIWISKVKGQLHRETSERNSNQEGAYELDVHLSRNRELLKGEVKTNSAWNFIGISVIALSRHYISVDVSKITVQAVINLLFFRPLPLKPFLGKCCVPTKWRPVRWSLQGQGWTRLTEEAQDMVVLHTPNLNKPGRHL